MPTKMLLLFILMANNAALTAAYGQTAQDSIYNTLWANKGRSAFQQVDSGIFTGTATGYIEIKKGDDTLVLDFRATKTTLNVLPDDDETYDRSTKLYSTQTSSGKTTLTYTVYALANVLKIILNGTAYQIGSIDGAADTPLPGLLFNYCLDNNLEYLSLYITRPLQLNNVRQLIQQKKLKYDEALKMAAAIAVQPGSTLIFAISKN